MKTRCVQVINRSSHALPAYATVQAAGMDLRAFLEQPIVLQPMERFLVPTGLFIALPPDTHAEIRSRSGLAWRHGLAVLNSPGTIDADYRGELKVLLINLSRVPFTIEDGARIAQMVIMCHQQLAWKVVPQLETTDRGKKGFGSTGVH